MTLRVIPVFVFWRIFRNDRALNQPLREREESSLRSYLDVVSQHPMASNP